MPTVMNGVSLNALTTVDTWSALSLFANGEQGTWYDPSDMSTMFQDAAGTTPVTAVEQPVGLLFDKSKGLVVSSTDALGGNGNFSNASYWQDVNGVSTISGGQLSFNGSATLGGVWSGPTNNPVTIGRFYQVTFDVVSISSGGIRVWLGTGQPAYTATTAGSHTYRGACTGDVNVRIYNNGAATTAVVDNVVIREVLGNHARQSTDASRPVLSARVNLLTYTEQFDNAAWPKANATAGPDAGVAPDGTTTAEKILETATTGPHAFYNFGISISAAAHTLSVYLKAAERTWAKIAIYDGTNDRGAWFNLSTGAVGTKETGVTAEPAVAVGNGWYRCSITRTTVSGTGGPGFYAATADNVSSYAGTLNSGIYIWGADLRVANDGVGLPAYQRVGAATDYDTSGFPLYLKFDGVDDSLATASIDFSATDKMSVFAGVRKLSDPTPFAVVAELSANSDATNGTFNLYNFAPALYFAVNNRGTAITGVGVSSATYAGPYSAVLNGNLSITPAGTTLRINGTQVATNATTVGTGNYANAAMYIGRRGGTTNPLNGNLYSLIVRGALSNSTQIENAENYINSKTKAY